LRPGSEPFTLKNPRDSNYLPNRNLKNGCVLAATT